MERTWQVPRAEGLTPGKELVFRLVAVALPCVALLAAELVARQVVPDPANDPYLQLTAPASVFSEVVQDGRRYYQITHPQAYNSRNVRLPVEKPPGKYRIFCLGESACAGWPHPPS